MDKRPTAWDAEKFWLFIYYTSFQFPAYSVNISDLEINDLYQHSHKAYEFFTVYHPPFDIFSSVVFSSQTDPQFLIKVPSCCSHDTQHSLIPLVLPVATSRHPFLPGCQVTSQLERLSTTVHFCKGTLHSCLPRAPFFCAPCQAQAASPTVPPRSAVHFPPAVATDNFQVKSYKLKLNPQLEMKDGALEES